MFIVQTENRDDNSLYNRINYIRLEDHMQVNKYEYNANGLKYKYDCGQYNNIEWCGVYSGAGNRGTREFSTDNQEITKKYLLDIMSKKDKINIVEIGVNRNPFADSSTSIFLLNKRDSDTYIGIDIEDKSHLDNIEKNIYTIKTPSENIEEIFSFLKSKGVNEIDVFMIDGLHTTNQCYIEWENYTKLLSNNGCVIMHDTNSHIGPYFLIQSIDTDQYDVYKYLSDVEDWGISVAVRK